MIAAPRRLVSPAPRLVIAGLGGDSGKTLVALALIHMARRLGLRVEAFKKGPDYIDAAWLTWATGEPARNLDTFLAGADATRQAFAEHALHADLVVIEGNRGLYDGVDAEGTHSTAQLAKILDAPVLLVVNAAKVTRTVAACVLGCQAMDPAVRLAGVVLNRTGGSRHEQIIREALESTCRLPVLGVVPRLPEDVRLPDRHLGLVMPAEYEGLRDLEQRLIERVGRRLALDAILAAARSAPDVEHERRRAGASHRDAGLRVGYVRDLAFSFYYPENLERLAASGATLVPVSSLANRPLPEGLHALYIGGGFPETHAAAIAASTAFLADLRRRADEGLPIYAECGGLMLLSRAIHTGGASVPMAGVLPCDVEMHAAPQGHGYTELRIDRPNPFFHTGLSVRGHEFHYSSVVGSHERLATAAAVARGVGVGGGRDGIVLHNVWASYSHVHALATPEWAAGVLRAARARARTLDRDPADSANDCADEPDGSAAVASEASGLSKRGVV